MRAIQNGVPGLHIQQIQLHGIPRIDVLVREEEAATQQDRLGLIYALLPQGATDIHPVHWKQSPALVPFPLPANPSSQLTLIIRLELLAQTLHLGIAILLHDLALEGQGAELVVRQILVLRLVVLAHQSVFLVIGDADLRADDDHELRHRLRVVHQNGLHSPIQHADAQSAQLAAVLQRVVVVQDVVAQGASGLQPNALLVLLVGDEQAIFARCNGGGKMSYLEGGLCRDLRDLRTLSLHCLGELIADDLAGIEDCGVGLELYGLGHPTTLQLDAQR